MRLSFKWISLISFFSLIFLFACSTDSAKDELNLTNPDDTSFDQFTVEQKPNDQIGFVRYKKDELKLKNNGKRQEALTIDRMKLADHITQMLLNHDNFEEVATLVTDREVLIAYEENPESDSAKNESIAENTAMSATPRYYDIYVSNNEGLMKDIHSLHNSSTQQKNYNNTLKKIINEMKKKTD